MDFGDFSENFRCLSMTYTYSFVEIGQNRVSRAELGLAGQPQEPRTLEARATLMVSHASSMSAEDERLARRSGCVTEPGSTGPGTEDKSEPKPLAPEPKELNGPGDPFSVTITSGAVGGLLAAVAQ
jgi:hypothetical protein